MSRKKIAAPDTRTMQQRIDAAAEVLAQAIVAGIADIRRETPQAPLGEAGSIFFQATTHSNYSETKEVKKTCKKKIAGSTVTRVDFSSSLNNGSIQKNE